MNNPNDFNIDDFLKDFDRNLDKEVKNVGNQNKSDNSHSASSRKGNFSVNIDRNKKFVDDEEGYIPAYNGEIYFANHTPLKKNDDESVKAEKKESIKDKARKKINPIPINVATDKSENADIRTEEKITPSMVVKAAGIRLKRKLGKDKPQQIKQPRPTISKVDPIWIQNRSDSNVLSSDDTGLDSSPTVAFKPVKPIEPVKSGTPVVKKSKPEKKPVIKKEEIKPLEEDEMPQDISMSKKNKKNKKQLTPIKALKKKYRKRKLLAVVLSIAFAVCISLLAISCINDVLAINRDSETIYTVTIPNNATTESVIDILKDKGLIKNAWFCNIIAEMQGFRNDNYIPGIYYITQSMGLEGMLVHFKSAQTTGETVRLVFPEGYNVDQIMEKLEKYEVCSSQLFKQTMKDVDFSSEYPFLQSIEDKDKRYHYLEGYLYPDTYDFYVGENPANVIRKFLDNFKEKWTDEMQARANELNMSMDEVLTLASIIQKEAYGADQMPDVSSVIHNRLNYSALYPTLKCDCTYYYVENYIKKYTTDRSLVSALNSRYNTNDCIGLPIGAICNPGGDAINAALNPTDTNYYFFAHDDNNKIYLAENESGHNNNLLTINEVNKSAKQN